MPRPRLPDGRLSARARRGTVAVLLTAVALVATAPAWASSSPPASSAPKRSSGGAAPAPVPRGFVGVDVDGPVFAPDNSIDFDNQVASMVANGVQSVRVAFNWAAAEPYASWQEVPKADNGEYVNVDGKPFSFTQTDTVVGAAAQHGVTVLPTVLYTPDWDARNNTQGPINPPQRTGPYADYLTALIGRYGRHGSFWRTNPQIHKLPIRAWQVWNEENLTYYWPQPFASTYVGLLRAAHAAIHRADPGARLVLGALTNFAWRSIGQIYRAGGRNLFEVASVNGFTAKPANVILYLRFMRSAMAHFKDGHKPLLATEVSWPAARGKSRQQFSFDTTAAGQARNIAALLPMIGAQYKRLHLAGFDYYTWMGDESDRSLAFNFAGLLRFLHGKVTIKPALGAFRRAALALEHCKRKGSLATSCIH